MGRSPVPERHHGGSRALQRSQEGPVRVGDERGSLARHARAALLECGGGVRGCLGPFGGWGRGGRQSRREGPR